ncbi:hypothetical protein [Paraburkholderia sp.]|uniref:hypothetical protein n=1 Tax=Paraburkholderia sp. TaxID=1926495 RepID=UPI0025E2848C|nr:hypothetical protein [Paraburkholderia sp.]
MENTNKKPLSDAQMAKVIAIALVVGAILVYLALKGNPWPSIALLVASWAYLWIRHSGRRRAGASAAARNSAERKLDK